MPYDIRDNFPSTSILSILLYIDFTSFATGDMKSSHSFSKNLTILWCGKKRQQKNPNLSDSDFMFLAPQVGLEPTTLRLTAECSAIELLRNITFKERDDYTAALRFCQPLFYNFFRTKRKDAENTPDKRRVVRDSVGHGIKRIEIALLCHQFVKRARFGDAAVLEGDNAVVMSEQFFLQRVGDDIMPVWPPSRAQTGVRPSAHRSPFQSLPSPSRPCRRKT